MSDKRNASRTHRRLMSTTLVPVLLLMSACATAADSGAPPVAAKARPVTLESVAGSPNKRVVLSAKAAERLDVKVGAVSEQAIVPTQMMGGIVVHPSAAGGTSQPATGTAGSDAGKTRGEIWIRVALSPSESSRLAKDKPARIFPLATRPSLPKDLMASPTDRPLVESSKSGMVTLFYVVQADHGELMPGDRVRVELQLEGGVDKKKVVPYSAVYYDAKGDAWVYVNTAPLAFIRERISVDRVAGDLALLSSGPAVGTPVATVGVSLLYGAEIFGK